MGELADLPTLGPRRKHVDETACVGDNLHTGLRLRWQYLQQRLPTPSRRHAIRPCGRLSMNSQRVNSGCRQGRRPRNRPSYSSLHPTQASGEKQRPNAGLFSGPAFSGTPAGSRRCFRHRPPLPRLAGLRPLGGLRHRRAIAERPRAGNRSRAAAPPRAGHRAY